ncbi:MAG TPA: class I SAM-dependent methyltransferase [Patescibacteria group bacterium]|nr:class I SAM-dependent methyltransferase [Patescibacteria group bacterium]
MTLENLPIQIKDILSQEKFSESERRGLNLLTDSDLSVYSPGISTGGIAELKMALGNKERIITATSIDDKGIDGVVDIVRVAGLEDRIKIKKEDVSEPLPYVDESFDYIYARLLLHYLPKDKLDASLKELHRVLKKGHKMFVVVRSLDDPERTLPGATYDDKTSMTSYPFTKPDGSLDYSNMINRYFHSAGSITSHLKASGFEIEDILQHDERLYQDFGRSMISPHTSNVVEVIAAKV